MEAQPDILNAMLVIAKIQSTGASNRIEGRVFIPLMPIYRSWYSKSPNQGTAVSKKSQDTVRY